MKTEQLGPYTLSWPQGVFPLGGDSLALGGFATIKPRWKVCDLGTGSGALLLLLARRAQGLSLTGVELDPLAARTARDNLMKNGLAGEIVEGDLRKVSLPAGGFDLVISNPPYFPLGSGTSGGRARSEEACTLEELCAAAAATARTLGYEPLILTDCLSCEAREAGVFLANMVRYQRTAGRRIALIAGGETVVHLTGHGKGGRNQELALAAAPGIAGLDGCAVFSVGSDGTDGPTDAAGGFVDSTTQAALKAQGCDIFATLADNDAYHALQKCNGLIITGPTGTNVNDVSVALVRA